MGSIVVGLVTVSLSKILKLLSEYGEIVFRTCTSASEAYLRFEKFTFVYNVDAFCR